MPMVGGPSSRQMRALTAAWSRCIRPASPVAKTRSIRLHKTPSLDTACSGERTVNLPGATAN